MGELSAAQRASAEASKRAETLEKKVEAMNKLHREAESRAATKLSAAEAASREIPALRAKVAELAAELDHAHAELAARRGPSTSLVVWQPQPAKRSRR